MIPKNLIEEDILKAIKEVDEGVIGDMHHIVEVGEGWAGIPYEKLYSIAERGDTIDMNKLEELEE